MQRFLAVLAVAAIAAFIYTTAAPGVTQAGPTAQQFAALNKQAAALRKTTKRLKSNQAVLASAAVANFAASGCLAAITSDEFIDTWWQIDQLTDKLAQP